MEQSLEAGKLHRRPASVDVQGAGKLTSIELVGLDCPGLLSEISTVLADLQCNIVAADLRTHNSKIASVCTSPTQPPVAPSPSRPPLQDPPPPQRERQDDLRRILHADARREEDVARRRRRLQYRGRPPVTVEDYVGKEFTVVNVRCKNLPDLIFPTVCTLTHMQFVVFNGAVVAEGP